MILTSKIKMIIIVLFVLGTIFFISKDNWTHRNALRTFYNTCYYGKIATVSYDIKGYARLTNVKNESFYLGNFISYNYFKIEVGDSIAKDDSSNIILYFKKNGDIYEHHYDQGLQIIID